MNNEERNISEQDSLQEEVINTPKGLSNGALIGIIAGAAALVVAIVVVLIILLSGNKCTHVDTDDDYLCDNCGEHFDDGDEPKVPEDNGMSVTFVVYLDDGSTISDIKFTLTRGDARYELVSGADGRVNATIPAGTYAVEFAPETMPEYCWGETYGVKIEEGIATYTLVVVDNRPNGTENKPFPTSDELTEVTVDAGSEVFYSYRGASARFLLIKNADLVVNYAGNVYTATDGEILVEIAPNEMGQMTVFSIKNSTTSAITASMEMFALPGTNDNPFVLEENGATASVGKEQTVYYSWTADKDGVLVLTSPTVGNDIVITRHLTMVVDNEEIIIPITSSTGGGTYAYSYVCAGDTVKIGVSYIAPESEGEASDTLDEETTHDVEFSLHTYEGTDSDPIPVLNDEISLSIDKGAELVFIFEAGCSMEISTDDSISVTHGGLDVVPTDGKYVVEANDNSLIKITNLTDGTCRLVIKK